MGHAARHNPASKHYAGESREAMNARLRKFCDFFATREDYDAYLERAGVTELERKHLEGLLPERLQQPLIVS